VLTGGVCVVNAAYGSSVRYGAAHGGKRAQNQPREGVTEAAGNLQNAGLIKYSRGHITVLDRAGLEARTCECYAVVKKEFERLLPPTIAP
jgi:hypothetical protein